MLSDDEYDKEGSRYGGGRGLSPSRSRSRYGKRAGKGDGKGDGKGKDDGKGKGKGRGPKTTGTAIPEMGTVHRGTVASIQSFGCFVRIEDVLEKGEKIWVKVCNVKEEEGKYSVDMRYVSQKDGKDLDPNNINGPVPQGGGKDSNFK